jgi:hypothetical protein
MNKKFIELGLLNYEGDVLTAIRSNGGETFVITDQYKKVVDILERRELIDFIFLDRPIIDSAGKEWVYSKESNEAKPDKDKLIKFLGL